MQIIKSTKLLFKAVSFLIQQLITMRSSWLKIFAIFASLSFLSRIFFLIWQRADIDFAPLSFLNIFVLGFLFDAVAFLYIALVPLLYYSLSKQSYFNSKTHQKINKVLYFFLLYALVFGVFSEVVFWDEFQSRFNFIAVDYLVYTTEVIGNIIESYPMPALLSAIFVITAIIFFPTYKKIVVTKQEEAKVRFRNFAVLVATIIFGFYAVDSDKMVKSFSNKYLSEIAENGLYQLFSAYRNNEIDYDRIYNTIDEAEALKMLRYIIKQREPKSKFLDEDSIARHIPAPRLGFSHNHNIMFVTVESLSASFMESFGNKGNITPNLDELAKNGMLFKNLYATGTRTVRGLEALSLSIPPTPGNSIVRRPNNENLFNISSPLNERGYESKFIYGGFGYFDNMNYFFGNNGFEVIDRTKFADDEIEFANVWGVSDEDLFKKAIKEADKSYESGKPFLNFVMTTSNHRPYTYPEGKINIASKTGRNGAVKYTDYAIGKLIEEAKTKPWFDNTIFVIVADHCAGSAGNTDVPLWRYQIPAVFYAPKIIKPQKITKIASQIDIVPTLFGAMNLSYNSKFFGSDIIDNKIIHENELVFVSTYSDIGYYDNDKLYLLKPKKEEVAFDVKLKNYGWQGTEEVVTENYDAEEFIEEISFYQLAAHFFKSGKLKNFTNAETTKHSKLSGKSH